MTIGRFRNDDLSVYFFVKSIDISGTSLGSLATIVDGYPYNEIETSTLTLPTVSIEAGVTSEIGVGELGASWYRRVWDIDIFAVNDVQRDDLADKVFRALDCSIPARDYSGGFRKDTGLSKAGTELRIIEYMIVENRSMRPTYGFNLYQKVKYWRSTLTFETISTGAV